MLTSIVVEPATAMPTAWAVVIGGSCRVRAGRLGGMAPQAEQPNAGATGDGGTLLPGQARDGVEVSERVVVAHACRSQARSAAVASPRDHGTRESRSISSKKGTDTFNRPR